MEYRQRFLNCLRGKPVDRLPFIETASFKHVREVSDFREHIPDGQDPLSFFGFDNAGVPSGYELVPVDPYALPRFEEVEVPSEDGYRRTIDSRFGRVSKSIPARPGQLRSIRVFERHVLSAPADWQTVKKRFRLSTEGRFPDDWEQWCVHSCSALHPIVLNIPDPAAMMANLMGFDEPTGLVMSTVDRPDLVRKMVDHFTELNRICTEKVLREARVDMAIIGSDLLPMLGPDIVRDLFLESYASAIAQVKSHGIELVCLQGRGHLLPQIGMFREIGITGVKYIMEAGNRDSLPEILRCHGDNLFYPGNMDGRVLLGTMEDIDKEVDRKIELAKRYRMIPCLHVTHILPEVGFDAYLHYVQRLREAIEAVRMNPDIGNPQAVVRGANA